MENNLEGKLRRKLLDINGEWKLKNYFVESVLTIEKMLPENQRIFITNTIDYYDVIATTIGEQGTSWPKIPITLTLYNEDQSFYGSASKMRYKMEGNVLPYPSLYKGFDADVPLIAIQELMDIKSKKFPLSEIYLNNQNFREYSIEKITQDLYGAFRYCNHMLDEFKEKKIEEKMRKNLNAFFEKDIVLNNLKIKEGK